MMLWKGGGKGEESKYGWRWQGGTHPTGAKKELLSKPLTLECQAQTVLLQVCSPGPEWELPETFSHCRELWGKLEGIILENRYCISFSPPPTLDFIGFLLLLLLKKSRVYFWVYITSKCKFWGHQATLGKNLLPG